MSRTRSVSILRADWLRNRADAIERRLRRPILGYRYRKRFARSVLSVPAGVHFAPPTVDLPSIDGLPEGLRGAAEAIVVEAGQVLEHRMRFVSDRPRDYGDPIPWKTDPESGHTWPDSFHLDLKVIELSDSSDPIRVWELSRGHQLLTLARASRLDPARRTEYLSELAAQLDDWIDSNPTGYGINWGNAMEAGIRATNWIWAIATAGPGNLPPETLERVTRSLQQHGRFIRRNLEGTRFRRGNHYLADLLGLTVIGGAIDGDPELDEAARYGAGRLPREVSRQVNGDGGNFEGSGLYHGLVLEMLVLTLLSLERAGKRVPEHSRNRVAKMIPFALAIRHPNGRTAQYGDSDSGRVLPGGFNRPPSHDPVIWTASAILGTGRPIPGDPDPEIAWILGVPAWEEVGRRPYEPDPPPGAFPTTGIYVLEGGGTKVIVDCGPVGQDGFGGHAHDDALSFELSCGGIPVVVDPGTFSYTGDPGAREAMRSTGSHPTPQVDGAEINPIASRRIFQLPEVSPPFVSSFEVSNAMITLEAGHDAYRRLESPVSVRRCFELEPERGRLTITDRLEGAGHHSVSIPLPLHPSVTVESKEGNLVVLQHPGGRVEVEVGGVGSLALGEYRYSDGYGIEEPASRLVLSWEGSLPHLMTLRVTPLASDRGNDAYASSPSSGASADDSSVGSSADSSSAGD